MLPRKNSSSTPSKSRTLAAAIALALLPALPAVAQDDAGAAAGAQARQTYTFDIPAKPLPQAIADFSATTGLQVLYTEQAVFDHRTEALTGSFTPMEALERLLAGSGLAARMTGERSLTIEQDAQSGDSEPYLMQSLEVTADRRVQTPVNNIPGAVTVLDGEELRVRLDSAQDTEKVLVDTVPGYNDNPFPTIRGRTALVLINGAPQNETLRASSAFDIDNIDPDMIERIEVSRGANALFGYGAPGGVINIITRRADTEELSLRTKVSTRFNPEAASDSLETNLYQSASQQIGKFDYLVGLGVGRNKLPFDDEGERIPEFSKRDSRDYSVNATLGYEISPLSEVVFRANYRRTELVRAWELAGARVPDIPGRAERVPTGDDGYLRDQNYQLDYRHDDIGGGTSLKAEVFVQRHFDSENQSFGADTIVDDRLTNDSQGIRTTFNSPLDNLLTAGSNLTYGIDYLRDEFSRPAINIETGDIETYFAPPVTLDTYAAYAQLEVPLGEDWLLSGGARHERYEGETEDSSGAPGGVTGGDVKEEDLTLFNAGVVYFLNDELDVYGSVSQGTNITELGRAARSANTVDQVRLEADPSTQYEVGFRGEYELFRFTTAAFYTESDKGVTLVPDPRDPGNLPLVVRREPRKTWGFEATGDYIVDEQWGLGGNFTFQEGRVDSNNNGDWQWMDAGKISPIRIVAYLDYAPRTWWDNRLQANYRFDRDRFDDDSTGFNEGNFDSILLVDYYATFDAGRNSTIRLGIENLLNEGYITQSAQASNNVFSWVKGEGRTIAVSYTLDW